MKLSLSVSLLLAAAVNALPGLTVEVGKPRANFNPNAFVKKFATCKAVERSGSTTKDINLKLGYIDINPKAKKTIVMVHGWPSLWTTYRNQIDTLGKDYRLIIVELRGFGDSQHPKDLFASNTMPDFVNDLMCVMSHARVNSGICMGNDFGAQVCWEAGRMRPDRFIGVFNLVVPYVSSALPFIETKDLAKLAPGFGYQLYLSNNATGAAKELDADTRNAIRSCAQVADSKVPADFLIDQKSFLKAWYEDNRKNNRKDIPFSGIMSKQVEDYMVASYKKQGFFNTFNGYQDQNRLLTYQFERAQGNFTLNQPTFTLYPTKDPVANWAEVAHMIGSANFLTNHFNATIDTAHWSHEERPAEYDAIFRQWVGNVTFPAA